MTTIHADRPNTVERPSRPAAAPSVVVPDHVPAQVAAEHADAATVVGRRPTRSEVRVVGRGDEHRSPSRPILALAAGALLAAFAGTAPPAATPATVSVPTTANPQPGFADETTPTRNCPAWTSVGVACDPPCPTLPAFSFGLGSCSPADPASR